MQFVTFGGYWFDVTISGEYASRNPVVDTEAESGSRLTDFSNYHGVEDDSLTMMFSGKLVGVTSQAGIFLNYLASYAWHMNYHTPEVGSTH